MDDQSSLRIGLECLKAGRIDEAIGHLEQAATAAPDDYRALDFLGVAYAQKGLYSRAVGTIEAAVKLHPRSPGLHYNLGQAYRADGMYDKAKEHYQMALKIDPMYLKAAEALKLIPSAEDAVSEISCAWHTDEPAVDKCSNCHLPVCAACKTPRNGQIYCPKCVEKIKIL